MKDKLSLVVGIAAGALAMYYLDPLAGRRRRALVRDQLVSAGHETAYFTGRKAKRAADRVKGYLATHRPGRHAVPESDQQLHDRIRARLGHVMHSPRSVEVQVEHGRVCLRGHILRPELDRVLHEVSRMAGVVALENQLVTHETAAGIPPSGAGTLEAPVAAASMH